MEQRADGQSEVAPRPRLHCAARPRPEGRRGGEHTRMTTLDWQYLIGIYEAARSYEGRNCVTPGSCRGAGSSTSHLVRHRKAGLLLELLLRVWSLSECSSCRILSMVCFLSCSSWSLVSLTLAAVAPVSRPVWGPEAEWRRGLCCGGPRAWGERDQNTSLERERLSAWRRLSGTALVFDKSESQRSARAVRTQHQGQARKLVRRNAGLDFTRESCS